MTWYLTAAFVGWGVSIWVCLAVYVAARIYWKARHPRMREDEYF